MKPFCGKILKCIHCQKECNVPKYRLKTFKYCSRSCQGLNVRVILHAKCLICDKEFNHISSRANRAKYCSRKCYHKSQIGRGRTQYSCKYCHKIFYDSFSVKRVFCSKECIGKHAQETYKPTYQIVRKKMKKYGLIEKCNRCGFDEIKEILGVHHRDRDRKNNIKENLEVLCPNCHSIEHFRHIIHCF